MKKDRTQFRARSPTFSLKPLVQSQQIGSSMSTLTANPAPCQEAPSPVQPMLFAPNELLRCGLSDAHSRPLVGERHAGGIRSWRESPATAWDKELIELSRTATSYAGLVFDCDSRQSVELAAASCVGCGPIPPPNFASERRASGHFHVGYFLGKPVHRGEAARARPLAFIGRIAEYFTSALGSDTGYRGVLSYNPTHRDYVTSYPRAAPYDLGELAAVIPAHWRVPTVALTSEGRNCALFASLCRRGLRDTDLEGGAARGELLGFSARAKGAGSAPRVDRDHPESRKGRRKSSPLFFTEEVRGGVHTSFRSRCHPLTPAAVEAWRWFVAGGQWPGVTKCMSSSSAA